MAWLFHSTFLYIAKNKRTEIPGTSAGVWVHHCWVSASHFRPISWSYFITGHQPDFQVMAKLNLGLPRERCLSAAETCFKCSHPFWKSGVKYMAWPLKIGLQTILRSCLHIFAGNCSQPQMCVSLSLSFSTPLISPTTSCWLWTLLDQRSAVLIRSSVATFYNTEDPAKLILSVFSSYWIYFCSQNIMKANYSLQSL